MPIHQLISPRRVVPAVTAASKQRLLETLSTLLGQADPDVDVQVALHAMMERERLGSTGIGDGVAIPHGRLKGLKQAIGAFVTLEHEIDYDALDRKPVRMAFALLVPDNAAQEHLQWLRELAMIFSNKNVREHLLHATSADEMYRTLIDAPRRT
jgi:PTS system nitrogen regulatory IIA component